MANGWGHTPIPPRMECSLCQQPVPDGKLQPYEGLGFFTTKTLATETWDYMSRGHCPVCGQAACFTDRECDTYVFERFGAFQKHLHIHDRWVLVKVCKPGAAEGAV